MGLQRPEAAVRWLDENIIDLIRRLRIDLIKDFLDERFLCEYLLTHYRIREVGSVRIEFIRAALKELLISPVDRLHYGPLITRIRDTDSASLTEGNDRLFYNEIETVLRKYL